MPTADAYAARIREQQWLEDTAPDLDAAASTPAAPPTRPLYTQRPAAQAPHSPQPTTGQPSRAASRKVGLVAALLVLALAITGAAVGG